ncbi:uncharacterized protein LOC120434683 [Oreochromis aureus]|uniref:uncharacterized protein LOC120434683 n=1 Tax=Oreochromis aureus TaxID=47969 RepID=UPI0019542B48|nr:uncharacterized protein LOC120434683 [Oreochromis aureus]
MKTLVVFLLLMNVSQHALTMLLEVNKGVESVLLPCQYSGIIPEINPIVMWTRYDLNPKSVHLQREGGDDLGEQNQHYRGRTSMRPDALDTGDFSLTLRNPELTDSGNYTCSLADIKEELRWTDIQLEVKDQQVEVKVEEGSESVLLPCKTKPDLPEDTRVEWTRSDLELLLVHVYSNGDHIKNQDGVYRDRTRMNEDLLKTGDLSLTLKYPTERDSGGYICTIYRDKDILRQKVVLQVKEPFPSWATALLVLLVLLVVSGGLLFHFRQYFMSVYKVEADSEVEPVLLPCKTTVCLPKDAKVEWKIGSYTKVHVYQNGSDQPEEQDKNYKGLTKMKRNLPGDLSLTLKHPTDTNTYTCTVYSREGNILMEKQVELKVRVPQVEVDSGVESVQLPFNTTLHLPEDAKVEWKVNVGNNFYTVHVYKNGSDHLEDQLQFFRDRTKMNEDLLKTGDLSLTLKYPTDDDRGIYTCTVYSREGNILLKRKVELKVRVCQVEVEEGAESVQLPFKTTQNLPEDAEVEWKRIKPEPSLIVHVYKNGSDQPEEQHQVYRDRTKMNKDLLKTGDLSLTLKHPTERNSGEYECVVVSKNIWIRYKSVQLKVKGRVQVQDQTGDIRNRSIK